MRPLLLLLTLAAACQPKASTPATETRKTIVAKIDGETITQGELEDSVKGRLQMADAEYRERIHDLKSDALDQMIDQLLRAVCQHDRVV